MITHYKILERLGAGGMGVVYKAEDTQLRRTVALKFLPPEVGSDPGANARFMHEAQAASALDHPNICTIHEIGRTDEGQLFICMAYYEGETLKQKIERGPLKIPETLEIVMQIARGLARAHERGITHRDIKPANILIEEDGQVKIVDFGLAKLSGRSVITKEGTTLGTVYSMSPEQVRGEPADARTDIWSLGVVMYEMICGRRPFEGEYDKAVFYAILNAAPEPVTALRTGVPMALERIVAKCMEKNASDRYQRLDELIVDVRQIQKGEGAATIVPEAVPPRAAWSPGPGRMRAMLGLSLAIAALLAAAWWFAVAPGRGPGSAPRSKSIAVLPFSSITNGPDDAIFADGIHDDILTQLTKIREMRVIGRQSMMQYRNSPKRLREIGSDLNAGYILEGTVRRSPDALRITAKLIDAETEGSIWSEQYDKTNADVLAIQTEIAKKIAASLLAVLSPRESISIEKQMTTNPAAYDNYLKGNYYWFNGATDEANDLAVQFYNKATALDPRFAVAFARASIVHSSLYGVHQDRSARRLAMSTEALARATALDAESPDVHHARGVYDVSVKEDPAAALAEYRLALNDRPGDTELLFDYGYALVRERKMEEALTVFADAIDRDPKTVSLFTGMNPEVINAALGRWEPALKYIDTYIAHLPADPWGYYEKSYILTDGFGDLDGARGVLAEGSKYATSAIHGTAYSGWPYWRVEYLSRQFDRALSSLEADSSEHNLLFRGIALSCMGRKDEARGYLTQAKAEAESLLTVDPTKGAAYLQLGMALSYLGQGKEALQAMEECLRLTPEKSDPWLYREKREEWFAQVCVVTGNHERALEMISDLLRKPSFLTAWKLRMDPVYDPLRKDPHFQALVAKAR